MERFTLKLVGFKIFSEEFFEIPIEKMKEKNTSGPKTAEKKVANHYCTQQTCREQI